MFTWGHVGANAIKLPLGHTKTIETFACDFGFPGGSACCFSTGCTVASWRKVFTCLPVGLCHVKMDEGHQGASNWDGGISSKRCCLHPNFLPLRCGNHPASPKRGFARRGSSLRFDAGRAATLRISVHIFTLARELLERVVTQSREPRSTHD